MSFSQATRVELLPGDESLVLASESLLQVLSPQETAMLLHYFHAGQLAQLRDAIMAAAEAAAPVQKDKAAGKTAVGGSRRPANIGQPPSEHATAAAAPGVADATPSDAVS
jgi:hypothetical protein